MLARNIISTHKISLLSESIPRTFSLLMGA